MKEPFIYIKDGGIYIRSAVDPYVYSGWSYGELAWQFLRVFLFIMFIISSMDLIVIIINLLLG